MPPDLTIHGMSIAEMNNQISGGVQVSVSNSPSRFAKLAHLQRLQNQRLNQSPAPNQHEEDMSKINDLLKIQALKKEPIVSPRETKSQIWKENVDLTYQVRTNAMRLKHTTTRRINTRESDLELDGVTNMDDQRDEVMSETKAEDHHKDLIAGYLNHNSGQRNAMTPLVPSSNQPRINVKLVPARPLDGEMMPSTEEPLSAIALSRLEPRPIGMNLNDQEERDQNYNVR